ncbi:MAG: 1-acyl-sn-glycerol-3-phosphate acyltransferase [Pseudomonadota bacterium]
MRLGWTRWLARGLGWALQLGLMAVTRLFTGVRPARRSHLPLALQGEVACVFFANHNSLADFIVLWTALPRRHRQRIRPVAAADHWGRTAWRRFLAREVFRAVLIERGRGADAEVGWQAMAEVLRQGESLILFPEGTRNTGTAVLQPFRMGLFKLAQACPQALLVPVWLGNTRQVLPKGAMVPAPGLCGVRVGAPLAVVPSEASAFLRRA